MKMRMLAMIALAAGMMMLPLSAEGKVSKKGNSGKEAATATARQFSRMLWDGAAPHEKAVKEHPQNIGDSAKVFVYLPSAEKANGKALVLCPGGGYAGLAMTYEGTDWGEWLNERGVALVVLQYRLPEGDWRVPVEDVQEALRLTRRNAKEWNINPGMVGVGGSSAGGHLAATASTHFATPVNEDTVSCRPDFSVLFYPVISMMPSMTHQGTRTNLLGLDFAPAQEIFFSNELQVTEETPRAWIGFSHDDGLVPTENGLRYYEALKQHGVPATLHIYPTGGHGWGYRPDFRYREGMLTDLEEFLESF